MAVKPVPLPKASRPTTSIFDRQVVTSANETLARSRPPRSPARQPSTARFSLVTLRRTPGGPPRLQKRWPAYRR